MPTLPADATFLLIDVQKGFDEPVWGPRNNPDAEANIERLLAAWRATNRPVIHIQHLSTEPNSPLRPDRPGCELMDFARPAAGEAHFTKNVNSAFIGTDLEDHLRRNNLHMLVVVGFTTNHCVSTTVRMAGNLGFETYLVSDATAAHDRLDPDGNLHPAKLVHAISLANLHGEFAVVLTTNQILQSIGYAD